MNYLDLRPDLDSGAICKPGGTPYRANEAKPREELLAHDPVWLGEMADGIISHEDDYQTFVDNGHAFKGAGLTFETWADHAQKHLHHDDSIEYLRAKWDSFDPKMAGEFAVLRILEDHGIDTSAYRAAASKARARDAFEADQDVPPPPVARRNRYAGIRAHDLIVHTEPSLIDGFLPEGVAAALNGPTGVGKTNCLIHIMCCVAHGIPVFGRSTLRRAVALVELEGARAVQGRIIAWHRHYGISVKGAPLLLIPESYGFASKADTPELIDALKDFARDVGLPLGIVALDTFHAASAGLNENDAGDAAIALQKLAAIRSATGATTLLIHHTGLSDPTRGRGSSAIRAALDTELLIEKADTGGLLLRATKQRDLDIGKPISFKLKSVEIGHDSDGVVITAPVAVEADPSAASMGAKLTGNAAKIWSLLNDVPSRIAIGELTRRFRVTWTGSQSESGPRSAVARALDKLSEQGLINVENGFVEITTVINQPFIGLLDSEAVSPRKCAVGDRSELTAHSAHVTNRIH